ncbi:MAG: hypothetical protein NTZ39_01860 [Methanoregula sp.]|nr:hypothetical protein [Methanoregula sp.]
MKCKINVAAIILLLLFMLVLPASATVTVVTSLHDTITKGDSVTITGTGFTNGTVSIWVIGRNYFDIKTAVPDKKGNFSFVVKPEETRKYFSGQYAFLVQDPGQNNAIEIEPFVWDDGIKIANRGKIVTDIGKKENLAAFVTSNVNAIINASSLHDVDDLFTPYYLYVEEPVVHFDGVTGSGSDSQLPTLKTGENVVITGTTNMGVENQLMIEIRNQSSRALITSGTIPIVPGLSQNRWSYKLDAPGLQEGKYAIKVGWLKEGISGTGTALLTVASQPLPPVPGTGEAHGLDLTYVTFIPLIISLGALGIIGIIILASVRR